MKISERAFFFDCEGESLLGMVSLPLNAAGRIGVLVVVGGPQYRVGSHRQFVLLARHLAREGVPCMRFDYRGMGDSTGARRSFEDIGSDIRAAIDAFHAQVPELLGVVLWGLCDGASAAAFHAPHDRRVSGLVLLNPWVKTEAGEARAYLRHYYLRRFWSVAFWKKLLGGGVALDRSLGDLGGMLNRARARGAQCQDEGSLPDRMRTALQAAGLPWLLIISGRDYVAREFEEVAAGEAWQALDPVRRPCRLPDADHTFSSAAWRDEVAARTLEWVRALAAPRVESMESPGEAA